jgi:signal transduction histidine kinase
LKALDRVGLGGRLLAIVLAIVSIDLLINSVLFESAWHYVIREDQAAWMADHIVVAHRVMDRSEPNERTAIAKELSTDHVAISWSRERKPTANAIELSTLHDQMLSAEPDLRRANLQLRLMPLSAGGSIGGSTTLGDGSLINFRFSGLSPLSLNLGRVLAMALPSALLLLLAWLLSSVILKPLRKLVAAVAEVGGRDPQPLPETGQGEVLHLIRGFNAMQERIHQLLDSNSQTLLAIGHDLRTPLTRLQLRIDDAKIDPSLRRDIAQDIDEMRDLLESLQAFVESGKDQGPLERIDVAVTAQTLVDNARDRGARASYRGPRHLEVVTRPVSVRRVMSNLVENALAYAGNAKIEVALHGATLQITVEDDGPGIPPDRMAEVLRPFIRLDTARGRDTAGMGLGLPIVERLVAAEGGTVDLQNKPTGGLRVTIRLPDATG